MRRRADDKRIRDFLRKLGRASSLPTRVYLVGGATAVIEGWRQTTVDVDLRIEPEDDSLLRRIVGLKDELGVNVELASPLDFIPELPGWRDRSPFVVREGAMEVFHFDLYAQALSKIERGFDQDRADVEEMLARGLVRRDVIAELFAAIQPELYRYPAIDQRAFAAKVEEVTGL